ncbi:MAG TPA: hypothetical protein VM425_20555, partial [Myxococcota bacterium]|nr:hypothetical protein [Myxococcota bacterium]
HWLPPLEPIIVIRRQETSFKNGCFQYLDQINALERKPKVSYEGISEGVVAYYNRRGFNNSEGDDDVSGWYQFHVGGGVDFSVLEWLDLGCELRLRLGFPSNPDVVSLRFFGTVTFRFPLSIKLHKRE